MSYAAGYGDIAAALPARERELIFTPRSHRQWLWFLPSILLCGASWLMGGVPFMTDAGFLILTIVCAIFLFDDFNNFSRRFGIGGMLLYGGVLVWFCHDYMSNWFMIKFDPTVPFSAAVVAKTTYLYSLFVMLMSVGLSLKGGKFIQRLVLSVPEPGSESFYIAVILGIFAIGISPFFIWVSEPFYMAMFHGAFSSWSKPVAWTAYRTGNLNYSWSAYVAQLLEVGRVGAILASVFAVAVATRLWSKVLAWSIWFFWVMFAVNDGRRGDMVYMVMPAIVTIYIKYQARVAAMFKRHSWRAYAMCGTLGLALLTVVQIEGPFRDVGLAKTDFSQVHLFKNQGNSMFSEGLMGYALIPDVHNFFSDNYPGESIIRPIPDQIFWFLINPIPRALWTSKPVDPLWSWYNAIITGDPNGEVGTTIAKGLVGTFYFHYGIWGVIEGGILVGWLMGVCERCLQNSEGRPISILMSLGFAVWLFRIYRDFIFIDLWDFIVGAVGLTAVVYICRPFMGSAVAPMGGFPSSEAPLESGV